MAAQGLFSRAPCLFSTRFLLNHRLPQVTQISDVRQKAGTEIKKVNLPEKPKKPLSPYFRFIQERRPSIVKKHPDWKVTQVSVQCAADWKNVDPSTKEKYANEYKAEIEKYAEKYLQYSKGLTDEQKEALHQMNEDKKKSKILREKRKKTRELDKPKKPAGAYMLFIMEQAKLQPDKTYVNLMIELKDKWATMGEGDKAKYALPAARALEKYEQDLKQWEIRMIKEGNTDVVRRSTLAGKTPRPKRVSVKKSDDEISD